MEKQTAVEWLAEKLEYVNWMRNRDEISAGMADEWRKHYLEQAKAMEEENTINFALQHMFGTTDVGINLKNKYVKKYNDTFK